MEVKTIVRFQGGGEAMCLGNAICFMFHVFMFVCQIFMYVSPMLSVFPKQISLVRDNKKKKNLLTYIPETLYYKLRKSYFLLIFCAC
jgi:hypothetical protein